jgi:hypothetical protein
MYLRTVPGVFNGEIDYAMLIKEYGNTPADGPSTRYSPAPCTGYQGEEDHGRTRPGAHRQELRGASEPDDQDEHAPVHATD